MNETSFLGLYFDFSVDQTIPLHILINRAVRPTVESIEQASSSRLWRIIGIVSSIVAFWIPQRENLTRHRTDQDKKQEESDGN